MKIRTKKTLKLRNCFNKRFIKVFRQLSKKKFSDLKEIKLYIFIKFINFRIWFFHRWQMFQEFKIWTWNLLTKCSMCCFVCWLTKRWLSLLDFDGVIFFFINFYKNQNKKLRCKKRAPRNNFPKNFKNLIIIYCKLKRG